jgi:hypothetical protein
VGKDAWERTLADADRTADELAEDGWRTLTIPTGAVTPKPPAAGETDRFGFVHVVPGNYADEFSEEFDDAEFTGYDVYRKEIEREVYFVTVLFAPAERKAVLLAGAYRTDTESALEEAGEAEGMIYTHLQRLDGTHLCSVEHDQFEKFFGSTE